MHVLFRLRFRRAAILCAALIIPHTIAVAQETEAPAAIADRIDAIAAKYQSVRYTTIFNETKVANPFARSKNPKRVSGHGRSEFIRQGDKWFVDLHTFSVNSNSGDKFQRHTGGGFDGKLHWHRSRNDITLAEEYSGMTRHDPATLFWHAARSRDWLLHALRHESAKVTGTEKVDDYPCVRVEAEFDKHRFRFAIAPDHGYLPVQSEYAYEGNVQGVETLGRLTQNEDGLWYPGRIRIENPHLPVPFEIRRVAVRDLRSSNDVAAAAFEPPQIVGMNYVDHRTGQGWHYDPWWPDLKDFLRSTCNWPHADMQALADMSSYGAESGGRPAPPIKAATWIGNDPGPWDRDDRRVTVVFFFGGRAIRPTPTQWASLKRLQKIYGDHGLEIVGITTQSTTPETARQTADMLQIEAPIAIDSEGGEWGSTYAAFGLRPYTGVFVVDQKAMLHTIERKQTGYDKPSELESTVRRLLEAAGAENLPPAVPTNQQRIDDHSQAIEREWRRLVRESPQSAVLTGMISSGFSADGPVPLAGATVQLRPQMRMLISNNTSGSRIFNDRRRNLNVETDENGQYRFADLAKGTYQLRASADGKAFDTKTVTITVAGKHTFDIELQSDHTITGRVLGPDKLPVFGAVVKLAARHPDPKNPATITIRQPVPQTDLDRNGNFHFEHLQTGHYTVEVTADGFKKKQIKMVPLSTEELVIELESETP